MDKKTVLNLGWGVQSFTMVAMVALGDMPKPDLIIHADTTHEREDTYKFSMWGSGWLEEMGLTVYTVRGKKQSALDPPWFTGKGGMLRRQCTEKWKIAPLNASLKTYSLETGFTGKWEKWIGISLDEWQRVKSSTAKWYTMRYPLIERRMTRTDCAVYLKSNGLPIPPKSSCVFCPYHNKAGWQSVKQNQVDWEKAMKIDEEIRDISPDGAFVHVSRIPVVNAVKIPQDFGFEQLDLCDSEGGCFL